MLSVALVLSACSPGLSEAGGATVTVTTTDVAPTQLTTTVTVTEPAPTGTSPRNAPRITEPTSTPPPTGSADLNSNGGAGPSSQFPTASFEPRPGYIGKEIGQQAALGATPTGPDMAVIFSVDKIQPSFKCTSRFAQQAENGGFLGVHLTVQLTDHFDKSTLYSFDASRSSFTIVGDDGAVENDVATSAAYSCLDSKDEISQNLDIPGTTASGWLVFDTEYTHGSLLFTQFLMDGGWEWHF